MTCAHPQCTGKHTDRYGVEAMCPAALAKKRARTRRNEKARYWRDPEAARQAASSRHEHRDPQRRQWTDFKYDSGRTRETAGDALVVWGFAEGGHGCHVSRDPDSYWPDCREDVAQEKAIAMWQKEAMGRGPCIVLDWDFDLP